MRTAQRDGAPYKLSREYDSCESHESLRNSDTSRMAHDFSFHRPPSRANQTRRQLGDPYFKSQTPELSLTLSFSAPPVQPRGGSGAPPRHYTPESRHCSRRNRRNANWIGAWWETLCRRSADARPPLDCRPTDAGPTLDLPP